MSSLIRHVLASVLIGALIGAVAGLVISEFMPEGALGGAVIGASIGAFYGARIKAYRDASGNAVRHHIEGTRTVGSARNDLIRAADIDQQMRTGIHGTSKVERRHN